MARWWLLFLVALSLPAEIPSPKWLKLGLENRLRWEGFSAPAFSRPGDYHLLNRYRLSVDVIPAPWLKFQFQVQDARVYWKNAYTNADNFKDVVDLRIASVTLGEAQKSPVWVTAGRQELSFGDQRLVGAANWGATGRTFDAVKVDTKIAGIWAETFAASVVRVHPSLQDHHVDGNNLFGTYWHLDKLIPKAKLEPYAFWRVDSRARVSVWTYGARWTGKLPQAFDYNTETVFQRHARAVHLQLGRTHGKRYYSAETNFASPRMEVLYPTPHYKYGLADQVGWKNIRHARAGVDWKLIPRLAIATYYNSWWLEDPTAGLFNAGGVQLVRPGAWRSRHVGQELDLDVSYDFTKKIQLRGGVGHLFPGAFLRESTAGKSFTFPYLSLQYGF